MSSASVLVRVVINTWEAEWMSHSLSYHYGGHHWSLDHPPEGGVLICIPAAGVEGEAAWLSSPKQSLSHFMTLARDLWFDLFVEYKHILTTDQITNHVPQADFNCGPHIYCKISNIQRKKVPANSHQLCNPHSCAGDCDAGLFSVFIWILNF